MFRRALRYDGSKNRTTRPALCNQRAEKPEMIARANANVRPASRPDRIIPRLQRVVRTLARRDAHRDLNACNPSVSALNGISAAPIEKLVAFVGTPEFRISA